MHYATKIVKGEWRGKRKTKFFSLALPSRLLSDEKKRKDERRNK